MKDMITSFQNKDYKQFDTFYELTSKQVFFTLKKYIKDSMLVEDLMQETYIKFLKHIVEVKQEGNIQSYLTTIARNLAIDYLRKTSHVTFDESFVLEQEEHVFVEIDFMYVLKDLDVKEKNIVQLHIIESMTFKSISEIENEPLGTIIWRYHKALKKMKAVYKTHELENISKV